VCAGASAPQRTGLPIVVLGGDHGDLPLDQGAGQVIADLVVVGISSGTRFVH
jgi:hypothetical protein